MVYILVPCSHWSFEFVLIFRLQNEMLRSVHEEVVERAIFGPPFLGPSPTGASRVGPEEDCLAVLAAAERDSLSLPDSSDYMASTA